MSTLLVIAMAAVAADGATLFFSQFQEASITNTKTKTKTNTNSNTNTNTNTNNNTNTNTNSNSDTNTNTTTNAPRTWTATKIRARALLLASMRTGRVWTQQTCTEPHVHVCASKHSTWYFPKACS